MDIVLWSAVFIIAMAGLIYSADRFVEAASKVGAMLGAPEFVIGLTVVALGTSLPELATSAAAAIQGKTEFVVGNAVGSNVANIFLVLGAAAMTRANFQIRRDMTKLDLPLLIISSGLLALFAVSDGRVGLVEGLFLVAAYGIYLTALIGDNKTEGTAKAPWSARPLLWLSLSGAGIYFGADYTLTATVKLSALFGWDDTSVLALTIVALGTSLPELAVSLAAARRGALELAVGNVLGSNVFNSLMVVGLPALVSDLAVSDRVITVGLPFMGLASLAALLALIRRRMGRPMGALFVLMYLAFSLALMGLL